MSANINPELIKKIKDVAAKAMERVIVWLNTPDATGKSPRDRLMEEISRHLDGVKGVLTPEGLKIALSYKEESRESLSFQDMLTYIKTNYKLEPGVRVCVLKTDGDIVQFDIMVCDMDNNPSFSPIRPWVHFNVLVVDDALINMFGDKSLLVLK